MVVELGLAAITQQLAAFEIVVLSHYNRPCSVENVGWYIVMSEHRS